MFACFNTKNASYVIFYHKQRTVIILFLRIADGRQPNAHCLVRLDEVDDIVRHLVVTFPWDVLHLVVDDDWCEVVLLLEDFRCLGGESCGGVGTGDVMDGCKC